ncbi:MAG: hypothetical protein ABJL99_00125 [Aliishimia sp.]
MSAAHLEARLKARLSTADPTYARSGAARQTGHSPQLQNLLMSELTVCGLCRPSFFPLRLRSILSRARSTRISAAQRFSPNRPFKRADLGGIQTALSLHSARTRKTRDMAALYETAVLPARPRKPKDKAKVEGAVLLAERWILARLPNQTFFNLDESNAAIRPLRTQLNNKIT